MNEFTNFSKIRSSSDSIGFLPMGLVVLVLMVFSISFSSFSQSPLTLSSDPTATVSIEERYMEYHDLYKKQQDPKYIQFESDQRNPEDELTFFLDTTYVSSNTNPAFRYIYNYTSTGYLQTTKVEKYEAGTWENYIYENCTYDEDGNKLSKLTYVWYMWDWVKQNLETYTYDDNNNALITLVKIWENDAWVNDNRSTYVYNITNNVASHLLENWDNNAWVNFSREIYIYDDTDNMLTVLGDKWLNNQWTNDQRYTYTYDPSGNMLTGLSELIVNGNWQNVAKETFTYNGSNNRTAYLSELWEDGTWVNFLNYTYTYDGLEFLESVTGQKWENASWLNLELENYAYSTFGGVESMLVQHWNGNAWEEFSLAQYDYDEYGNAHTGDYYSWNGSNWTQEQDGVMRIFYDFSIETAVYFGYHIDVKYESILVGLEDEVLAEDKLYCYPNPSNKQTTLSVDVKQNSLTNIHILDISGKKIKTVYSGQLYIGTQQFILDTEALRPGLYVVAIETEQSTKTTKLLITRN